MGPRGFLGWSSAIVPSCHLQPFLARLLSSSRHISLGASVCDGEMGKPTLAPNAVLNEKKGKLFQQLEKLNAQEDDSEDMQFMGDILRELMRVPAKIRPCRRAVLSTL